MNELLSKVLQRKESFFKKDLEDYAAAIEKASTGGKFLIVGGAGSIGRAFVKCLCRYNIAEIHIVDPAENSLVELVRDLRSGDLNVPSIFKTYAIRLGDVEFKALFNSLENIDYILNFSALKHVRSERDPYSLMNLINTNIIINNGLIDLAKNSGVKKIFSVSSDKAVNPANLMGASKALMERLYLSRSDEVTFSSARFANVAFSDGSLLAGFKNRLEKEQPIAAPNDVRRYFISEEEAGELCLLSCLLGKKNEVFFPKLNPEEDLYSFSEIAEIFLKVNGFIPVECSSEKEAKEFFKLSTRNKKEWPCYFTSSNTTGEKSFEEFYSEKEKIDLNMFNNAGAIIEPLLEEKSSIDKFLKAIADLKKNGQWSKKDVLALVKEVVSDLKHQELGNNLDAKM